MSDWADFGEPAPALQKMPVGASSAAAGAGRFAPTCCPSALSGGCAEVRQFLQAYVRPGTAALAHASSAAQDEERLRRRRIERAGVASVFCCAAVLLTVAAAGALPRTAIWDTDSPRLFNTSGVPGFKIRGGAGHRRVPGSAAPAPPSIAAEGCPALEGLVPSESVSDAASLPMLWPMVAEVSQPPGADTLWLYPGQFEITTNLRSGPGAEVLRVAIARMLADERATDADADDMGLLFPRLLPPIPAGQAGAAPPPNALLQLYVSVTEPAVPGLGGKVWPSLDEDESYSLDIGRGTARLCAPTVWGALAGLQTFAQLVEFDPSVDTDPSGYVIRRARWAQENSPWKMLDRPRFRHRGLLVDLSRHWQPPVELRRLIESISWIKLNVLHLHLTDDQSFPVEVDGWPKLWAGAYSINERYTREDMAALVDFARVRGVRVLPEWDVPGHADSWCIGYPDLCPSTCAPEHSATKKSPLSPASNKTLPAINGVFSASAAMFSDSYVHLGGDEADTSCWNTDPAVVAWREKHNRNDTGRVPGPPLRNAADIFGWFIEAVQTAALKHRKPIHWEEVFDRLKSLNRLSVLSPSTIIQIWLSKEKLSEVVASGFQGILSNSDLWYLDNEHGTWQAMYANEPLEGHGHSKAITSPEQIARVLGGEACMWGERVDVSDLESTVFPRLVAVAERLWSPRLLNSAEAATARYHFIRCLLDRRGVNAAPANNDAAREGPADPGGCIQQ